MRANLIIPCGGVGKRSGLDNKLLHAIDAIGTPTIIRTIANFMGVEEIQRIILPCPQEQMSLFEQTLNKYYPQELSDNKILLCNGGGTRTQSVRNALDHIDTDCQVTIVHDGARPFVTRQTIIEALACALEKGSAIAAVPATDTIAIANAEGQIDSVPDRGNIYRLQTPQAFLTKSFIRAYSEIDSGEVFTDDSSVYLAKIGAPYLSKGMPSNIKLTYKEDYESGMTSLVGVGYDTHRLVEGRKLILGGVTIPHTKGLLGHSDADALLHAIMDAILTASNMRDIGVLFPDTDPQYKDISSQTLLQHVRSLISQQGYSVGNISAVIMAQQPKLAKYIPKMRQIIAAALGIGEDKVGLSATTTEGLGFVGREEGIAVHAICTVNKVTTL